MGETPATRPAVYLARDLRAVLPIGIPLGWQAETEAMGKRFAIRRGGRFCYLDQEGQELWTTAWQGLPRQPLIEMMAAKLKRTPQEISGDLNHFVAGRLLLQLGGDWREDWERISTIRVLPRAIVTDCNEKRQFRLVTPDGQREVWLSLADYAVWSAWDGTMELSVSLGKAAQATGYSQSTLKQRAHSLLIASIRARAIFMDEIVPGGD